MHDPVPSTPLLTVPPPFATCFQVYAVDLLGQGQSWPSNPECDVSGPLRLSADTWTEQLHHFIQVRDETVLLKLYQCGPV
jgi:pimeloyl-ACP methyl ester carboxylesterase